MANESKNVFMSLQKRCVSELTTDTLAIEDQDILTGATTAWHRVHLLGVQNLPARIVTRDERWLFQISNFAKTGTGDEGTLKVWEMFDDVYAAFHNVTFNLTDWADTDAKIADIICSGIDGQVINESNPELTHLACTFSGLVIFNP